MAKKRAKARRRERVSAARDKANRPSTRGFTTFTPPDGVQMFRPDREGIYRLNFYPFVTKKGNPYAKPGMEHYERTYWRHDNVGANPEPYLCLRKTFNKKCPICEYLDKEKNNPKADEAELKKQGPKERQLFLVVDLDDQDKGIQLWESSYYNGFGEVLDNRIKNSAEEKGWDYFFFPDDEGFTLEVTMTEASWAGQKFYKPTAIDFVERDLEADEKFADQVFCLDDILKEVPYDELKSIFLQLDPEDEEADDEESEEEDDSEEEEYEYEEEDDSEEESEEEEEEYDSEEEEESDEEYEDDSEEEEVEEEDDDLTEDDDEWDDEWSEEEEEEPAPKPVKKKTATKKKASPKLTVKKSTAKKAPVKKKRRS